MIPNDFTETISEYSKICDEEDQTIDLLLKIIFSQTDLLRNIFAKYSESIADLEITKAKADVLESQRVCINYLESIQPGGECESG